MAETPFPALYSNSRGGQCLTIIGTEGRAQYKTPNDVKAGTFSANSKEFAAAYHYGHDGGYTWIGIWSVENGEMIREERRPGWTTDICSVLEK